MKREIMGTILLFLLALYSMASISWYPGGNSGYVLLTGIMASSAGGAGALFFYKWRICRTAKP